MPSSGTLNAVNINGVSYDVPNDINVTILYSDFELEAIATSGETMFKYTRRSQNIEGVTLMTPPGKADTLRDVANGKTDVTMSLELADGTVLRSTGRVNYENWETEENRSSLMLMPNKSKKAWVQFAP